MSGYIYTLYKGADPARGWVLTDPIFEGVRATLGACVPNIRNAVRQGDWIFSVSGRVPGLRQFVIGGFKVIDKIDHLAAYGRFPENRLTKAANGQLLGNIIVQADGSQHPYDGHKNFDRRIRNYIVGGEAIYLTTPDEFEIARSETIETLSQVICKDGQKVFDLIGRHRKLSDEQTTHLRLWLENVKAGRRNNGETPGNS